MEKKYTEKEVEQILIESPELIRTSEQKVLGFSNNISTAEAQMEEMSQFTMAKIANKLNHGDKKLFNNKALR